MQVFEEAMAFALADAGCEIVKFGLESGSPRVRKDVLWRYMTNERIERAFAAAHAYDLHTSASVMFGLPTETRAVLLDKMTRAFHWWVNAASDWPCAPRYQELVAELEGWDRAEWEARRGEVRRRDRELSERLLAEGVRHYSIRYTHVMGVDSEFVLAERARLKAAPEYVPVGYTLDD